MEHEYLTTVLRLLLAVTAGALIGLERTYHGRPAGFRTHTLVCTASSLLMLLSIFQWQLIAGAPMDTVRVDPTRMAQGIMTGIGFLGAGVIMKERLKIRGLTTAASLWLTASIGIVIGMGLYFAASLAIILALGILIVFRWIEGIIPSLLNARLTVRFIRHDYMPEEELQQLIRDHGMDSAGISYSLENEGKTFVYQMTIRAQNPVDFKRLAESLNTMDRAIEFYITPTGD